MAGMLSFALTSKRSNMSGSILVLHLLALLSSIAFFQCMKGVGNLVPIGELLICPHGFVIREPVNDVIQNERIVGKYINLSRLVT